MPPVLRDLTRRLFRLLSPQEITILKKKITKKRKVEIYPEAFLYKSVNYSRFFTYNICIQFLGKIFCLISLIKSENGKNLACGGII